MNSPNRRSYLTTPGNSRVGLASSDRRSFQSQESPQSRAAFGCEFVVGALLFTASRPSSADPAATDSHHTTSCGRAPPLREVGRGCPIPDGSSFEAQSDEGRCEDIVSGLDRADMTCQEPPLAASEPALELPVRADAGKDARLVGRIPGSEVDAEVFVRRVRIQSGGEGLRADPPREADHRGEELPVPL